MTTAPTFAPGDKVRIVPDARYCDGLYEVPSRHCGAQGTVRSGPDGQSDYSVVLDEVTDGEWVWVGAASLEPAEEPAAEPETLTLVDLTRVQALHAARDVLGDAAETFDVVEVARFILGDDIDGTAPAVAQVNTSEPLKIEDVDGDTFRLIRATSGGNPPGTVAMLTARGNVYLTATDIDRVIAYLTALKG